MESSKDTTPYTAPVIRATSHLCLNSPLLPSNYYYYFFVEGRMVSYMDILWGPPTTPAFFTFLRVALISARSSVMKYYLWFIILAMYLCVSLLFKMLSRLVVAFLPRSKHLLISWLQSTICIDFGAQGNKVCHCFHCFPICLPWCDRTWCHDLHFWIVSFKPAFSLSSFTFIQRLFTSSSLSAVRVVSTAYL